MTTEQIINSIRNSKSIMFLNLSSDFIKSFGVCIPDNVDNNTEFVLSCVDEDWKLAYNQDDEYNFLIQGFRNFDGIKGLKEIVNMGGTLASIAQYKGKYPSIATISEFSETEIENIPSYRISVN